MSSENRDVQFVYDDVDAITREVLERYQLTADPRLREIVLSLISHLHAFARDTNLSFDEWGKAMQYLYTAGQACNGPRNEFIALSDAIGFTMLVITNSQRKPPGATIPTLVGPFFVPDAPKFRNGEDISNGAQGEPLYVAGRVLDTAGKPVQGATLDVWHSDDRGLYDVQTDMAKTGMWARGQLTSDAEGRYSFWTIMPTAYPAPTDGALGPLFMNTTNRHWRPAHLHYAVRAKEFDPLITHVFVRGSKHIDEDVAFGVRPALVADFVPHQPGRAPDGKQMDKPFRTLDFDFVLTRDGA